MKKDLLEHFDLTSQGHLLFVDVPGNATEFKTLLMKAVPPTARIFVAALGEWESKNIPRADEWLEARKDGERQVLLPQAGDPH
ncbi:hypothetical protein [Neorhizobium galegae]|uniref:hypothetical protein n=1 Tax=Neorhizobium galegae TaxID=399 RepID=UPI0012D45352|nr:hypothetical protein [Neorhizobium galegae]